MFPVIRFEAFDISLPAELKIVDYYDGVESAYACFAGKFLLAIKCIGYSKTRLFRAYIASVSNCTDSALEILESSSNNFEKANDLISEMVISKGDFVLNNYACIARPHFQYGKATLWDMSIGVPNEADNMYDAVKASFKRASPQTPVFRFHTYSDVNNKVSRRR